MVGVLLPVALLLATVPATAAVKNCSYKKTLQQAGYVFDISSRPADGCMIQIVEVVVRRGAKQIARFKTDVDYLVESAWTVDLDKDNQPELAVASRSLKSGARGTFDVYWLDKNVIRRAAMQEHQEGSGYQGQDAFQLQGRGIARSFPVYLENDPESRPSGGMRTLQYNFSQGKLELNLHSATVVAPVPEPPARPVAAAVQPTVEERVATPVALATAEPASPAPLEANNQVIAKPVFDETANQSVKVEKEAPSTAPQPSAIPQAVEPAQVIEPAQAIEAPVAIVKAPRKYTPVEIPEFAEQARKSPTPVTKSIISKIAVGDGFIELRSTEPVLKYKIIKLDKPARIAIDNPGAQSGMATKTVAIGRHGISKARIGTSAGTLRIVLDSTKAAAFPAHTVTTADNSLRIDFTTAASMAAPRVAEQTPAATLEPKAAPVSSAKVARASSKPVITDIVSGADFIDIVAGGPIAKFKLIKLTEPPRLAIDIPLASSALERKTVVIGNGGIEKARIGNGPNFLRIVLDSSLPELPAHKVIKTERGLRIELK